MGRVPFLLTWAYHVREENCATSQYLYICCYMYCFIGVPLDVFININVNDISSISEVKMVSYALAMLLCIVLQFHSA